MKRYLIHQSLFGGLLRRYDRRAKKLGFVKLMKRIIADTHSRFSVEFQDPSTPAVLRSSPVIVVANHPHETDALLLVAALENRRNSYLVVSSDYVNLLPGIVKRLIPVYISYRRHPFNLKYRLFKKYHWTSTYSPEISHQKNIASIARASRLISHGSSVAIFPAAGGQKGYKKWYNGIGHLVHSLQTSKPVFLVMANLSGTSSWDYLRLFPFLSRFLPTFKVVFSPPRPVNSLISLDPKAITSLLEREYYHWQKTATIRRRFPVDLYYLARSFVIWFFAKLP